MYCHASILVELAHGVKSLNQIKGEQTEQSSLFWKSFLAGPGEIHSCSRCSNQLGIFPLLEGPFFHVLSGPLYDAGYIGCHTGQRWRVKRLTQGPNPLNKDRLQPTRDWMRVFHKKINHYID